MDCEKTCIERTRRGLSTTLKDRARKSVGEFRTVVRALGRPDVPWYARLTCGLAMLYIVSPIQLIPNFIPILGQMDDVLVLGFAMGVLTYTGNLPQVLRREGSLHNSKGRSSRRQAHDSPQHAQHENASERQLGTGYTS